MGTYRSQTHLNHPVDDVFAWYSRPGALRRLLPPWEPVTVVAEASDLTEGAHAELRLAGPPASIAPRWVLRHTGYRPSEEFTDVQVHGPFAAWSHRHMFERVWDGTTVVRDVVRYRLPLRSAGGLAEPLVESRLRRMFDYRYRQLAQDLAAHDLAAHELAGNQAPGAGTLTVAVTGAGGLIGTALCAFLTTGGHRVLRLVRRPPATPDEVRWDPAAGTIDADALRDVDAVVHLAGAPIAGRFSEAHKRNVLDSRVAGTGLLARTLARLRRDGDGPRVLISGSAVGYYGPDRAGVVDEDSGPGEGFLAELCRQWEAATCPAAEAGLRVVRVRTGVVQTPAGGALRVQLPLFAAGVGGRLGTGRQWLSWISLDDVVGVFHRALFDERLTGAVNAVAPHPVTNDEYTRTLGRVLRRPTLVPAPAAGPRLLLGQEGAREFALANQNVHCRELEHAGHRFRHPDLETCLRHVLGRWPSA